MPTVVIIGAGTMGAGIAQVAAQAGWDVQLCDLSADALARGVSGIRAQFARLAEKGRISTEEAERAAARVRAIARLADLAPADRAPADRAWADLAIEAVIERLDVKHATFAALEKALPAHAVLATNTSSLSVGAIARAVRDPSRVIGMHFFNPAPLMPLVEVIAAAASRPDAVDFGAATARAWGKTAVHAKDTPGFIVNRVARGYYLEALRLLGEHVSTVEKIDKVMKELGGFKMGPFELMDLVGLDVNYSVSLSVWEQMQRHPRFEPHEIQRRLVDQGCLGRKTGRGFYDYTGPSPVSAFPSVKTAFTLPPEVEQAVHNFAAAASVTDPHTPCRYIFARILCAILNEAALARQEGVASASDIDIAMKLGTNYPHGPLEWADRIGRDEVHKMLACLEAHTSAGRFRSAFETTQRTHIEPGR
ncbi:MAG: hypothetical protein IT449_01495 [Phycisphaerales bacterium]|nr:hypothetical protein [Phycisphaerales bacterium]